METQHRRTNMFYDNARLKRDALKHRRSKAARSKSVLVETEDGRGFQHVGKRSGPAIAPIKLQKGTNE